MREKQGTGCLVWHCKYDTACAAAINHQHCMAEKNYSSSMYISAWHGQNLSMDLPSIRSAWKKHIHGLPKHPFGNDKTYPYCSAPKQGQNCCCAWPPLSQLQAIISVHT
jgi:hypothetical protein